MASRADFNKVRMVCAELTGAEFVPITDDELKRNRITGAPFKAAARREANRHKYDNTLYGRLGSLN